MGRRSAFASTAPQLPSLTSDDEPGSANWTLNLSDVLRTPSQPLVAIRNIADPSLANVTVPLAKAGRLHRLTDSGRRRHDHGGDGGGAGSRLHQAAGFRRTVAARIRPRRRGSSELRRHHHPKSYRTRFFLGRPGGLTLSSAKSARQRATSAARPVFDPFEWRKGQEGNFIAREDELIAAAGAAESDRRIAANLDLARFYMSRGMYHEAKGVLDLALFRGQGGS